MIEEYEEKAWEIGKSGNRGDKAVQNVFPAWVADDWKLIAQTAKHSLNAMKYLNPLDSLREDVKSQKPPGHSLALFPRWIDPDSASLPGFSAIQLRKECL
jgi:hypothetical protein